MDMLTNFFNMRTLLFLLTLLLCACTQNKETTRVIQKENKTNTSKNSFRILRDINGSIVQEGSTFIKEGYYYVAYPLMNYAQYKGGEEALREYLDSCYYQRPGYDYQEYNIHYVYTILFDKDMKILDVRITYRSPTIDGRFDEILKEALYNSEGNWEPKYKDRAPGYMMYNGRCHFW